MRYYALAATAPDLWNPRAKASIGGYCCLEHANAEPRPTRRDAEYVYQSVAAGDGCMCGKCTHSEEYDGAVTAWQRLLEVYPDPVPVDMDDEYA